MPARLIDSFSTTGALADVFSDRAVLAAMLQFEAALARTQAGLGMIPQAAADAIVHAECPDAGSLSEEARASATLAIPFLKALASRLDPDAAAFLHHGATSQDLLDTTLVLLLREARRVLALDHARLASAHRTLSDRHAATVMLARTLLQPALPTTFGYKVAGWYGAVDRSWRRMSRAFDEALVLQFGGPVGTLDAFGDRGPELAAALASALELLDPGAPWHTQRDRLAALVASAGIYTASLAKIARDIALLMQPEIAEVSEPGGTSSSMPHKRNPAGSVVTLAAAAPVPGLVAAFLSAMPQEHERAAGGWQSEWPTVAAVMQATGSALAALAGVIDTLTVHTDRMRANLDRPEEKLGAAEPFRRRILKVSEE
jgi:3-carboxy-cis,cis-muconate cycloisomerase